ncbi:MAG: hypothetical protein KY446_08505 [Proteobacteria bacterium]|nr:hypothetical protein [Pseudomonadota bacterium]MBW3617779.1 hypothetical protein [Pseudomonadota bacterium]
MRLVTLTASMLLGAAACSNSEPATEDVPPAASPTSAAPPTSTEPSVTPAALQGILGLTDRQTEEADIVDPLGRDLGDVQRLVRGPDGQVTELVVAVAGAPAGSYVTLPVQGLSIVETGGDRDLLTSLTREQLMELPTAPAG